MSEALPEEPVEDDEPGVELVSNWGADMNETEGEFDMPQRDAYIAGHMAWEDLDPVVQRGLERDAAFATGGEV